MSVFLVACDITNTNIETGDRLWQPTVYSIKSETEVELKFWLMPGDRLLRDYTVLSPQRLEIFQAESTQSEFKLIASFEKDIPSSFLAKGLKKDIPYFFFIKTHHEGVESKTSKTIMTIPSEKPDVTEFKDINNEYISTPSVNIPLNKMVYCNKNYTWDNGKYGAPTIFLHDLKNQNSDMIEISSHDPSWVKGKNKFVYLSDNGESNIDNYLPQHVSIYDINSKEIKRLTSGRNFNINPTVSNDGEFVVYASDVGHKNKFDLWKMKIDGTDKIKIQVLTHNLFAAASEMGMATWSKNDEFIYYGLASEEKRNNGIFKLEVESKKSEKLFETEWRDVAPSLSPNEEYIAFLSSRSGLDEIWIYDLVNKKFKQITSDESTLPDTNYCKFEWISDDSFIFGGYKRDNSGRTIVYKINI